MSRKVRTTLAGLAVVAGMFAVGSAPAQAATSATAAGAAADSPCGWFISSGLAKYNHCDYNRVVIRVSRLIGSDFDKCVGPGVTTLGIHPAINGAWYAGRTC